MTTAAGKRWTATEAGGSAAVLAVVVLLHIALIALLIAQSGAHRPIAARALPAQLIIVSRPPPPPPPEIRPALREPPTEALPLPDLRIAAPAQAAPHAITQAAPRAAPAAHFGAAGIDAGLGLDVAAGGGGGAAARGSLADFEAAVKRRILAGKRQPTLAWDRRNTCVVNYTVRVAATGALAGYTIDPCAVPEINAAAARAISQAPPFPRPPLGEAAVHGTLIFRP